MKKRERILNMIEHLENGTEAPAADREEMNGLRTVSSLGSGFFQRSRPPYNERIEDQITERVMTAAQTAFPGRATFTRIAFAFSSVLLIVLLSLEIRSAWHSRMVKDKLDRYLSLNGQTLEFLMASNMDNILQTMLQNNNNIDATLLKEEDLQTRIRDALVLYLSSRADQEFLSENREIIETAVDNYSWEYVDYIKENSQNILI